jgi:hypothetical protein
MTEHDFSGGIYVRNGVEYTSATAECARCGLEYVSWVLYGNPSGNECALPGSMPQNAMSANLMQDPED